MTFYKSQHNLFLYGGGFSYIVLTSTAYIPKSGFDNLGEKSGITMMTVSFTICIGVNI